jgi:hypothetical protein
LDVIRAALNKRIDPPRLMALVSPTCPFCLAGANAVIELAAS